MKKQKNRENGCLSALCNQFFVIFSVLLPATVYMAYFNFKSNNETIGIITLVLGIIVWALTFDLEIVFTPIIAGIVCWAIFLITTFFFSCELNNETYAIFAVVIFIIWVLMGLVYYFTMVRDYY